MIEADTLKQLEDALMAYREDQETLKPVVALAEQALGEGWVNELPSELASAFEGNPKAPELLDKVEHVIHYYGALTAWEEATSYVSGKEAYTPELLQDRLPVLEYWLKLFGEEGDALIGQVKELLNNPVSVEQESEAEEQIVPENVAPIEKDEEKRDVEISEQLPEEPATPEAPEPIAPDEVVSEENILETSKEVENEQDNEVVEENVQPVEESTDDVLPAVEEQSETVVEDEIEQQAETTTEEKAAEVAESPVSLSGQDKEIPILDVLEEVDLANQKTEDATTVEKEQVSVADKALSELEQLRSVNGDEPVFQANDYAGLDAPAETVPEKKDEPEEKGPEIEEASSGDYMNVATESKNWDIAVFLRQKKLYEDACNWLSAWCIRMDGADKTEYPYYGFIVDLMYDLKDKAHNILDNQLLDEIIEKDIKGGRTTVEKVVEALDKEIDGLPDDLKLSTPEKIKLSAREILGQIDTSTEKEDIDAPPDGFELMDDPYSISTDQIISDFEKTERETEKKIDNLNVIDENKQDTEKGL